MEMMENQPLLVIGSNRKQGDTRTFMEQAMAGIDYHLADLLDYSIAPYSYDHSYPAEDDFALLSKLVLEHQVIVFATPVYWYSMSGLMKTFFDRITDLTTFQKQLGRKLKGKSVFLLAVGTDPALPQGYLVPFERTCQYLDMEFKGSFFRSTESPPANSIFKNQVLEFQANLLSCFEAKQA